MAAETEDITYIKDEDVLRRLWQSTEDFARKKEIRARMYKLREQRLKEFYTTGEVLSDVQSVTPEVYLSGQKPEVAQIITKHSDNSSMALANSIEDQGFLALKTKEIRDSKSPTRDFQVTQEGGDNSAQSHWKMESSSESYRAVGSGEQYEVTSQSQRSSMAGENDQVISNMTSSAGTHSIMNRNEAENVFADGEGRSLISYKSDNVMSLAEADSTARTVTGRVVSSHQSSIQLQKWGTTSTSKSTSSRVTSSTYGTESTMRDISDKNAGDTWVEEGTDGVTTTVRHVKKVENLGDQGGVMKISRVIETSGTSADYILDDESSGVNTVTVTKKTTTKEGGGARNVVEMRIMPSNEEHLTENDSEKTQKVITNLIKTSGLRSNENVDDSSDSTVVTEKIVKTARRSSDDIVKESSSVCTRQESRTPAVDRTIESPDDFPVTQDVQVQEMKKSVRNDQITGKVISAEEKIRTVDVERNEFETISEDGMGKSIIGKEITVKPALKRDVVEGTYPVKEERGFAEVDSKTKRGVVNINQKEVIQGSDNKKPGKSCRPEETQERQPETVLEEKLGPKEPRKVQNEDTLQITRERGENERFIIAEKIETSDTAKTTSLRELSRDSIPSFDKRSLEDASSDRAPCEYIDKAKPFPRNVIPEKKEGSYTTTYQWSFTPQKINIEVSASHAAFASSLRAPSLSPERASSPFRSTSDTTYTCGLRSPTKSISRSSLDRTTSSPKKSFVTEPQKTLRTSPTKSSKSPTNDRDRKPKAKTAPVMIDERPVEKTSKEARLQTKDKRKLPGTKKRSGTPGVSPSTSPERDVHKSGRIRTTSSSSEPSRQTYTRNVKNTKKESYCKTTNFMVRERSPSLQENRFTPIRLDHQRKSRNIKSSSSSPSTSPELKSNKSTHGQNATLKTKSFHEQNKKAQLMHRGKTNLITPDGRNLGPESTETPEKRRIVKKPTANVIPYLNSHKEKFPSIGKEEKQYRNPERKPDLKKRDSKEESELKDYIIKPEGSRQPRKPGSKVRAEPDVHYVTPDGRKVTRKPSNKPRNEPDDHYVTPDGREATGSPGSKPGDEPEDHIATPEGNRQPQRPNSKARDKPDNHYVTPDGREVPTKSGDHSENELQNYITTPDGCRTQRKPISYGTDDADVLTDVRNAPQKSENYDEEQSDDELITVDGRRVFRHEQNINQYYNKYDFRSIQGDSGDADVDYYLAPGGQKGGYKPSSESEEEHEHYNTSDDRNLPLEPGRLKTSDAPSNKIIPDGRRVTKKPETWIAEERIERNRIQESRNLPRKPETKPGGGESDRRNPSKPVTRKPVREALPKNGFVDMKRSATNSPCAKSADGPRRYSDGKKVQGNKVKPGNYVSPYSKRPTEKSREIRNESQYHINIIDTEESKTFGKEVSREYEYSDGRRVPIRDPRKGEQDIPHEEYNAPGGRRALDRKPEGIISPEEDAITREPVRNLYGEEGSEKYNATAGAKSVRRPQSECVIQDGRRVPGKKSGVNLNEHWVPGTKPETKGIEPKYLSNRLPRTPVHNYITPDGKPVAGKKLIGKSTAAQTYGKPNNSPLCTTNNSLPKRPEPSYATPTKASLMKKPTDASKSNNVRGKMSPTDDVTQRTLKISNYDENPRVRSTSDFINIERHTEIQQYPLFTNENDEEQSNNYEDCYEPLKHKTTSTISGPISRSSSEPRKVRPQHKSQSKKQTPFGQTPKLKTQGMPLRTKFVDSKSKPTPEHSANRQKKPMEKDAKKTKCTTSESSEAENDELHVEDTTYGEKHREYKISHERSKVKNTFNNRLREPIGVIEYPDSPRGSSPETQPRFTQVNDNRLEELIPRYPDSVTEPEDESDEESQPRKFRNQPEALREEDESNVRQRKAKTSEQDEPEEEEEVDKIVSVAQRVNKFMDAARKASSSPLPSRPEDITLKGLDDTINSYIENNEMDEDLDSVNAVKKAKTMFENIANSQVNTSDRRELLRHEDIVSRPSVFDRRGKSPEKQVQETNRDRRPVEPEALRRENLLKLGIRCPEDILNRDLFQKTELGDTFPRRKTPSPERPTGKFDTYPSRKYSVKDDLDAVSPKRSFSPEKWDSYVPKVMAKAVTNSSQLQPNNDDVPFVRQNSTKSSNIMSYPFSDKPKVNGYTRPEQCQKLSIPEDSDLKTPLLLKEPRKGSNQKATKPEEASRSPRAESPKKIYPEKDKPRTEKAQNVRNQSEDREPARRRPSGKVYAEEKSQDRRMSPNSRFPYDSRASPSRGQRDNGSPHRTSEYTDTRRSSSPKKNFEEIIPSERRQDEKMYPHDRGAHSSTSKRPDSPRRDYPHDKTATGRRPSGKAYPGDIGPYRGSPERNYQHEKATTRRLSGKEHSETENSDKKSLNHPSEKPTSLRRTSTGSVSTASYCQTPPAGDISHGQTNERPRDESPRTHDVQVSKFGVSLRRTSTSNSIMKKLFADVGRKESELDRIFDLEILESLLEQAKGYDERRGIRQQIRIVKKMIENKELPEQPFRRKSTQADYDAPEEPIVCRQDPSLRTCGNSLPDRRSPEKILPGKFETGSTRRQSEELSTGTNVRRHSSEQFTTVRITGLRKMTDIIDKSPQIKSPQIVNKVVKKSYVDDEMKEESLTDSITSSYGIGPTDEKGMPLFGLKALRRQNKSTPEVEPGFTPYAEEQSPRDIKDSSGRPLFGLKALQISKSSTINCVENQASESSDKTLKDFVNRHDKHARGNTVSQPQQRTPSQLRDTFAQNRDEDFIRKESDAEEMNHLTKDRGQSLRVMLQKHESLTESDRRPETVTTSSSFSSSAIIRSSAIRKPGGISVKSNVILGEATSRDGEKPQSRVRTAEYSYETPKDGVDDCGTEEERLVVDGGIVTRKNTKVVSSRSNTTESILSRTSRKSLSPERKSPDGESTGRTTKRPISDKLSHLSRKFSNEPEGTGKRPSGPEPHYSSHTKSSLLHSNTYTSSSAGADRHSSTRYGDDDTSSRRRSTTPQNDTSINRRRSSTPLDELKESLFRKSSTAHDESDTSSTLFTRYGRGGAVKALSQKFQQGGAEAESSKTTSSYPKAGLILRSASFKHTNGDLTPPDSPAYKQSVSLEARVGSPTAPRLGRDEKEGRESRRWSHDEESECNEYDDNRRIISKTVIETTESKSFLGNSSKVTGVQDIISRMKAADLEDVGFESPEDVQARSLLNKFLGASVMMSGVEPLVKASGNSSATLVSQVERQRILQSPATETIGQINIIKDNLADFDNIDNIWDERKLRQLLDACTDYEGRRKIRARLRTVMAEKSACEDVVAAAQEEENLKFGDGSKTVQAGESLLPYIVEQLRTSLILESRPGQKSEEGTSVMHMEDSGTESGEDLRLLVGLRDSICDGKDVKKTEQLNKNLLTEVQDALQKLQTSLNSGTDNALDPITRDTLLQLVTRLQSSLKLAPGICPEPKPANRARFANRRLSRQSRHTVGVTHEELADARRLIQKSSLTGGGNFIDTGQQAKTDKPGSRQTGISYAVVKQNSADDVTSKAPFKLFRPTHFNQGKLKISSQFGNSTAKPFLSSKQIQSADEWVRNQIGNTRRLSDSCAIPCSDPTYFSLEENSRDNCEVAMGSEKSSQLKKLKSPSPPYKNIQYAPSVFNQYEPRKLNLSIFKDDKKSLDPSYGQVHINDDKTRSHSPIKPSVSTGNGDSLLEYDPSLSLFTPEQSVKIAVHKAAINKQLSREEEKRIGKLSVESDIGSTEDEAMEDDGDISSNADDEDEHTVKTGKKNYPNAQSNHESHQDQAQNRFVEKVDVNHTDKRRNSVSVSDDSKKVTTEESMNRFEKRIQEIQNEKKTENRQKTRSIEELQKIYNSRKEKERKNNTDTRSQMIQNVQAKYQKNLGDHVTNQKTYNPQRLNPDIRSKYEKEIKKNMENDMRSKPIWNEYDDRRRKESLRGLEYMTSLERSGLLETPMDASLTESEVSISSTSTENSISHAQRLLRLATGENSGKHSTKKVKMKRANTIDIPKPLNYYDVDDFLDYTDDEQKRDCCTSAEKFMKPTIPPLEPRTESDKKFLALLRQQNHPKLSNTIWMKEQEPSNRNPFAEHQWGNRFSRIKTSFENVVGKKEISSRNHPVSSTITGVRAFWKSADDSAAILKSHKDSLAVADRPKLTRQGSQFLKKLFQQKETEQKSTRLPWTNQENVVVGMLTLSPQKPDNKINKANQFSHAPMSAFRPVERKVDPAKMFNNSAKISKPIPVMPDRQELGPFLPWTKEKPTERQLSSTVAKFESLSSRETSPILLSPRIKLQDKVNFMCSALEPSPPAVPIIRSPSQSNFVQSKTHIFTPSYPVVNVNSEPPYLIDGPQKNAMSNPVKTYSVDVAATNTIYPNIDALEYDSVVSTPEEQMAVTKVMGSPVQQQAVTVRQKTHRRNDEEDNRNCAAKSLTSMLQRFSSPPSSRGGGHDTAYTKSSLLPPNLPTGKVSPTSPGSPDERFKLRRPSSAESLALSNSSDEIRESEAVTTSRLQIPVSQYRTNSLQDLSPQGSPTPQQPADISSLRKSESCHQLNTLKPKRPQSLVLPDLPAPQRKTPTSLTKTKSSHVLSFPKQFEAVINPEAVEMKQRTVEEYLSVKKRTKKEVKTDFVKLDDNLENLDEAFDELFSSVSNSARTQNNEDYFPRGSNQLLKSISASAIQRGKNSSSSIATTTKSSDGGYSKITTERSVFTAAGSTKAASTNKPISPFAKFQQLDRQNSGSSSTPSSPCAGKAPLFTFTDPKLSRSASGVKDRLLQWCQMKTKNYKNIQIENFSTSWSNGLAFCALIHHFRPEAFDYDALSPRERRKNFELAFKVAEDEAGIAPLLDVEDMVMMKKPDWKCVFTYVQSIYCRFKNED